MTCLLGVDVAKSPSILYATRNVQNTTSPEIVSTAVAAFASTAPAVLSRPLRYGLPGPPYRTYEAALLPEMQHFRPGGPENGRKPQHLVPSHKTVDLVRRTYRAQLAPRAAPDPTGGDLRTRRTEKMPRVPSPIANKITHC